MIDHIEVNSKLWNITCDVFWCAPKLLKKPKCESQSETMGKKKVAVCCLTCSTLGVGVEVGALGWD
jgi:hypothetical protein